MKFFLALALSVAQALASPAIGNCNCKNGTDRIIAGDSVESISDIPFQVSIQNLGHVCSGAIVAPRWVLTSASCVVGLIEVATTIRYNSLYHNMDGNVVKVERILLHPYFERSTLDADLAMVRTTEAMTNRPAILANGNLYTGMNAQVAGWGLTSEGSGLLSQELKRASMPFINRANCLVAYAESGFALPPNVFCAGHDLIDHGGASICRGDLGAPLTYTDEYDQVTHLYGVASFALSCGAPYNGGGGGEAHTRQPAVFTSVRPYLEWIETNLYS